MTTAAETQPQLSEEQQRQLLATGKLFHALAADPKHRKSVLGLIKAAAPEVSIPELEIDADVDRRVSERVKPTEDATAELKKEIESLRTQIGRDAYRSKAGLSEDELIEVEEIAKSGKIGDPDAAVELWKARNAIGTPRGSTRPNPDADYLAEIRKAGPRNVAALKQAAFKQANRVLAELRGRRTG